MARAVGSLSAWAVLVGSLAVPAHAMAPRSVATDRAALVALYDAPTTWKLQSLCGHCNRTKGERGMEYLRAKLRLTAA